MRVKLLIIAALIAAGFAWSAWDMTRPPPSAPAHDKENKPAPNARFKTLDGKSHALSDFKGEIILLNFWASWCAPCKAEFPDLYALADRYKGDLVLIALSVDENPADIKPFLAALPAKAGSNVMIGLDTDKSVSQRIYKTFQYPETYIMGPDFALEKKIEGVTDWRGDRISSLIESLIARKDNP